MSSPPVSPLDDDSRLASREVRLRAQSDDASSLQDPDLFKRLERPYRNNYYYTYFVTVITDRVQGWETGSGVVLLQ